MPALQRIEILEGRRPISAVCPMTLREFDEGAQRRLTHTMCGRSALKIG